MMTTEATPGALGSNDQLGVSPGTGRGWEERSALLHAQVRQQCLMFDALGERRKRYVRVSLGGNHCVMHPSEGDCYLKDARDAGDESGYTVADVYLSEREFDDLPEHNGF
jgi:hypothetical protein